MKLQANLFLILALGMSQYSTALKTSFSQSTAESANTITCSKDSPISVKITMSKNSTDSRTTFTAKPLNCDNATYAWKLNGVRQDESSPQLKLEKIRANDVVSVVLTSQDECHPAAKATATLTVTPDSKK